MRVFVLEFFYGVMSVLYVKLAARRSHPAQYGEDRFGPPTLERSGSEHRVGRLHP